MSPNNCSCGRIRNLSKIRFESSKSSFIEKNLGISVSIMIDNNSVNWSFEIKGNLCKSIFVAKNNIFNLVSFEVSIIEDSVHFHLSNSVLASKITCLLDSKWFYTEVLIVLKNWLQNVNSGSFGPSITPFFKAEIVSHWFVSWIFMSLVEASDEIWKGGVLPFIFLEILMKACFHGFMT